MKLIVTIENDNHEAIKELISKINKLSEAHDELVAWEVIENIEGKGIETEIFKKNPYHEIRNYLKELLNTECVLKRKSFVPLF
jgi:hypothetical protein